MQQLEIRTDIPIPNKSIEYILGTKLDNELFVGASVFVEDADSGKLIIRLGRISKDKKYSTRKEEKGFRIFRIK